MKCQKCGQDNTAEARFCAACGASLVAPTTAGVGASYTTAWQQMWKHFLVLLGVTVIYMLISGASSTFSLAAPGFNPFFSYVYSILLVSPIGYGVALVSLRAVREEPVDVKDMFEGFHNYWNVVLAGLLVSVIIVLGFILLVVPGIIFACKLVFTPYLVIDRKMAAVAAIKESWRLTGGHAGTVFLMALLAIPVCIAGFMCLGVGIILAMMWISLAVASLYHSLSGSGQVSPQPGVPPI